MRIANPIYAEVVPRELTSVLESGLQAQVDPAWYVQTDGNLDLEGLLSAFQDYFRSTPSSGWTVTGTRRRGRNWCCMRTFAGWSTAAAGSGTSTPSAEGAPTC